MSQTIRDCCLTGFTWSGTPTGTVGTLAQNRAYITGTNKHAAILLIHDAYGWEFPNNRLLADHLAKEANATVFLPDFFEGEHPPWDVMNEGNAGFAKLMATGDLQAFLSRNSREKREPEIMACAKALRGEHGGFARVGASGYCFGGWACFRLAAASHDPPLVDAISVGHPTFLTKEDIDGVCGGKTAVQMLAPEDDAAYTPELKLHTFTALQAGGVPFEYKHFPGVTHACLIRGSEAIAGEREAMIKGKNAAVAWYKEWLHDVKP